jgi:Ca2+/Na+ antiporter
MLVYLGASASIVVAVAFGQIHLWQSILLLACYVLYVTGVVVWTRCIRHRPDAAYKRAGAQVIIPLTRHLLSSSLFSIHNRHIQMQIQQ